MIVLQEDVSESRFKTLFNTSRSPIKNRRLKLFSPWLFSLVLLFCSQALMAAEFSISSVNGAGTPTTHALADDGTTSLMATRSDSGDLGGVYYGYLDPGVMGGAVTWTVTFNVPITISSVEIAEITNNSTGNPYVLTPNVGTAWGIADDAEALVDTIATYAPSDWTGVTSLTYSYTSNGWRNGLNNIVFTVTEPASITSSNYDASAGILAVTAASMTTGDTIEVSRLTLAGSENALYTLTSPNVTASSSTAFSVTLNATDKLAVAGILDQDGFESINGSVYNLAAGLHWNETASSPEDLTGNSILVRNVTTAPGAPVIGTAAAGDAQASVAFSAPASDGGDPITGYTVTSSPGSLSVTCSASPCTVTGLTNGQLYTFTVTASNAIGISVASAASNSIMPAAVPDAPGNPVSIPTLSLGGLLALIALMAGLGMALRTRG